MSIREGSFGLGLLSKTDAEVKVAETLSSFFHSKEVAKVFVLNGVNFKGKPGR